MTKEIGTTPSEIREVVYSFLQKKYEFSKQTDLIQLIKEEIPQLLTIFTQKLDKLEELLENIFEGKQNGK